MSDISDMADRIRHHSAPLPRLFQRRRRLPPIGLSGFAGSGKTEAAKVIEEVFDYERRHIAEPLRRMLASLLGEYGIGERNIERILTGDLKDGYVIPQLGVTSRHLQITLGTEWGRDQVGADIWAKLWALHAASSERSAMNDSVRFPNEEHAIRAISGFTIKVVRPDTGPAAYRWKHLGPILYRWFGCMWGVHDSERVDRLRPDYVIVNDGTIEQLRGKVVATVNRHFGLAPAAAHP